MSEVSRRKERKEKLSEEERPVRMKAEYSSERDASAGCVIDATIFSETGCVFSESGLSLPSSSSSGRGGEESE